MLCIAMVSDAKDPRHTARGVVEADSDVAPGQLNEDSDLHHKNTETHSAPAAIDTLYDDALRLVFEEACVPKWEYDYAFANCKAWSFDTIPMTVSHVSRRWRSVALAFHGMWRYVHIGDTVSSLKLWLSRSGDLPFHIVHNDGLLRDPDGFSLRSANRTTLTQQCEAAVLFLLSPENRCRLESCSVWTSLPELPDVLARGLHGLQLPLLRLLDVGVPATAGHYAVRTMLLLPESRLETLALHHCLALPPWAQDAVHSLRELRLGCLTMTVQDIRNISLYAPNLISLKVSRIKVTKFPADWRLHDAPFLRLRSFASRRTWFTDLLICMDLPALESLALDCPILSPEQLRSLSRTYPNLRTLKMKDDKHCVDGAFTTLLQQFPSLTSLELIDLENTPLHTMFESMTPTTDPGHAPLTPRLEEITIIYSDAGLNPALDSAGDALIVFARQRAESGCLLRQVKLTQSVRKEWGDERIQSLSSWVTITDAVETS